MSDLAAIRAGIAANLAQITDLQVSAYMLAEPTPPSAHVVPGPVTYDISMGRFGLDDLELKVQVFVPLVVDVTSQINLDAYLAGSGSRSVRQAIERVDAADGTGMVTLGGACQSARVVSSTGPQLYRLTDGRSMLMCEWTVMVKAFG